METACLCRLRLIYKALGAFEASLVKRLGINFNEAMLLCLLSGHCVSDRSEAIGMEGSGREEKDDMIKLRTRNRTELPGEEIRVKKGCGGLKASEIADELGLSCSNASKVIASAENSGLVKRKACKEDARCMRLSLTQKGMEMFGRISCDELRLPEELADLIHGALRD